MKFPTLAIFALMLAGAARAESVTLIALGDMPYGNPEKTYPRYEALIGAINAADPDLVLHVGDTKSGGSVCSDKVLREQLAYLDSFTAPTLFTPGDNEWTDCHREHAGGFDPLERLDFIRDTYFSTPSESFGRKTALSTQAEAGFPENVWMRLGNIMVLTAHVVGSNNSFIFRTNEGAEEAFRRDAANLDWLAEGFEAGADSAAMVVVIHADMFLDGWLEYRESWVESSGFRRFGERLIDLVAAYEKPVLLIYGDSHVFEVHRPFPVSAPNLVAMQVFGASDMHAVEVTADPKHPAVFSIRPFYNPDQPLVKKQE